MNEELEKEIQEMEELITGDANTLGTEAPGTEAPGTEAPITELPGTEAPSTEAPSTEVPKEPTELELLRQEIAELKLSLKPKEKSPTTEAPATEAPLTAEDYLKDIDIDDLTRDPAEFNKLLNKFRDSVIAITEARQKSGNETVIRSIPEIVKKNIEIITELKKVSEEFYDKNKDLVPFKKAVASIFEEELSKNPDKKYEEILNIVAPEARRRLDLAKKATSATDTKPRLPKPKSQQRRSQPKTDILVSELDAMDEALNS